MIGLPKIGLNAAIPNSVQSNYKALVCIYLDGGNDAWNTCNHDEFKNMRKSWQVKSA